MQSGLALIILIIVIDAVVIMLLSNKSKISFPHNISLKWIIVVVVNVLLLLGFMIWHLVKSGYFAVK